MYQKAYLILIFLFALVHCSFNQNSPSIDSIINQKPGFPLSEYQYKILHNQVFLKVYIHSDETNEGKQVQQRWALLDSGSTVNLILSDSVDIQYLEIGWLENAKERSRLEFHNLGSSLPKEYDLVLGAPFFQSHCVILEFGIPKYIQPNLKKRCFAQEFANETKTKNLAKLALYQKNGLFHTSVQIGTKLESMAIDTGSGISSLSLSQNQAVMIPENRRILVMDIQGNKLPRNLYQLSKPIELNGVSFNPSSILDSDEVWDRKEGYSSTLGVDFLKTFRVYIDFGSKILGIDRNEFNQGQNHSRNEWGSR